MMKILRNKFIPFRPYDVMNLFTILFVNEYEVDGDLSKETINHESIHTAQQLEMGFIGFYIWYCIEYLFTRPFFNQHSSYMRGSLEEEAYMHQNDLDYLSKRKHYAWTQYLNTPKWITKLLNFFKCKD